MKKLTLALATTAIAAASSSFVTTAEAGGRGRHRLHFHLHQLHQQQVYRAQRHDDDDHHYVRRRKAAKVISKPVEKPAEKPVAVAKYADGEGRQFDLVSKVWFDGKSQCWMGDKPFAFKTGSWFYGNTRWIGSSAGWGVASGEAPEQVSCEGIKAFAAKLQTAEAKPTTVEPRTVKKVAEPKSGNVEQAELSDKPAKIVATTPAAATTTKAAECKKYFPSVGEMVSVPCSE